MVKSFLKVGQTPLGQNIWYQWKGLVTRNAHVKCKSSIYSSSGVKGKVKVFVHADALMYTHINAGGMIIALRTFVLAS